jgi:uncharacterized protein YprB with RNaseH-like and TPR domain
LLRETFVHIPGIGPSKERKLWDAGVRDWSAFRDPSPRAAEVLRRSEVALAENDLHWFYGMLPRSELWRLVPGNLKDAAFLDIETTGLGPPPQAESTTITFVFRGELFQEHERARKLRLIRDILSECSLIVSFFGEVFDVPFLEKEFGLEFRKAHVDLCFWLKRHGLKGGLKRIQKLFAEIPERDSMDIDGFDAVRLWKLHQRGVKGALDTLLTYNAEDTIVLEPLLMRAWELERAARPERGLPELRARRMPVVRTRVHEEVYALLRGAEVSPRY